MSDKTSKFLNAIKEYSEKERRSVMDEARANKEEAVKKAEIQGKADADRYVKKLLSSSTSKVTSEYAVKNLEAQGKIFKKRGEMTDEIFRRAEEKLLDFAGSPEYKDKLLSYAEEIAQLFTTESCVISLKPADMGFADEIKSVFNSDTEIKEDVTIRLGGLRAYCPAKKLGADNTLDSKLEEEKKRFVNSADLKL